jgi:hypothetical protein
MGAGFLNPHRRQRGDGLFVGGIPHIHESIANNRLKVFFVELKTAVIG